MFSYNQLLLLFSFLLTLPGCQAHCTDSVCILDDTSLRFFVLGDFGGDDDAPYTTADQVAVASTIAKMGDKMKTHFQLELGDNFYHYGVKNVQDPRFNETFRFVYNGSPAMYQPWYIIAGNHDHRANVSAQIAYSNNETRWNFPSLYYTVQYKLKDGPLVQIVMLDTIVLCGDFGLDDHPFFIPPDAAASESQWDWLEKQLKESKADYLFVTGHYPVYSIGEHGPTDCLTDKLEPMLYKYKVNAYMNGHDHGLQHLAYDKHDWTVNYIVSGAAAKMDSSTKHKDKVHKHSLKFHYPPEDSKEMGGFVFGQIGATSAKFTYYTGVGSHKYDLSMKPRK